MERNKVRATTWVHLANIVLCSGSQTPVACRVIPLLWEMQGRWIHRHRQQVSGCQELQVGDVLNGRVGLPWCRKLGLGAPVPNWISETEFWGEAEKNNFVALPGRGGHSRLVPSKLCVPTRGGVGGGFGEEFYSSGSRVGLLRRIRVCAGPAFL